MEEASPVVSRDILVTSLYGGSSASSTIRDYIGDHDKILDEIMQTEMFGDHVSDIAMEADDTEFEYWFNKM